MVAGRWNRAIFSPEWLLGRLTNDANMTLEVPLNSPGTPTRIIFDDFILSIMSTRLQIGIKRSDDLLMVRAAELVKKVLSDLIHTPVHGMGVNFGFLCESPTGKLIEAFDIRDTGALSDSELRIESTKIVRQLKRGDQAINLTMDFSGGKASFDFNFHTSVKNATEAIKAFGSDPIGLKNEAYKILQEVYQAEVQQEDTENAAQH